MNNQSILHRRVIVIYHLLIISFEAIQTTCLHGAVDSVSAPRTGGTGFDKTKAQLFGAFVFAIQIDSTIPLFPKSEISSL